MILIDKKLGINGSVNETPPSNGEKKGMAKCLKWPHVKNAFWI